ncbi:MAG: hypothetical protein U9Q80_06055 [Bacillota bacterium]|nr:hypothetical protein [Bacillota bacterium]
MSSFRKGENIKLLSTMTRWASIDNNAVFIFKKTYEQGVDGRYNNFFENFILRINRGMEASAAIEQDLNTIESPFMKNVFINIQSVIENNGDMLKLLSKFEHEAFNIEKTLYNNNIKNYKDRAVLFLMIFITVVALIRVYIKGLSNNVIIIISLLSISLAIVVYYDVGKYHY